MRRCRARLFRACPNSGVRPLNCADFIPPDINPSTRCNIFEYESSGRYNQNQLIVNFNSRLHRNATMNAYYVWRKQTATPRDTGSFPANPYDFSTEYGRASGDIRHRFVMTGNFRAPWGITLNPLVIIAVRTSVQHHARPRHQRRHVQYERPSLRLPAPIVLTR